MNDTWFIVDAIALGCGVYCSYTWIKLMIVGKLFRNALLIPRDKSIYDCSEPEEYIAYVKPRLGILAFVTLAYAIISILSTEFGLLVLPRPWDTVLWLLVIAVLIWYMVCNSKANRRHFGL